MIMIVKTPGSQKASLAAAEKGGEGRGGGRGERGGGREERDGECERGRRWSRRRQKRDQGREKREDVAMNETPRISPRRTSKSPLSTLSSLSSVIAALVHRHARVQRVHHVWRERENVYYDNHQ